MAVNEKRDAALRSAWSVLAASPLSSLLTEDDRGAARQSAERVASASDADGLRLAFVSAIVGRLACRLAGDPERLSRLTELVADAASAAEEPAARAVLVAVEALLASLPDRGVRSDNGADAIGAVQRRLARLRYDLHDGPQQDIHLLAQDLRLFRDQLRPRLEHDPDQDRVLGRLDDLEAQLIALDGDLRQLVTTAESPFLASASLPDALRGLTQAFAERTGVVPETSLRGSVSSLSDSQQIALLSLVREALSNIRRHSDAHHVQIAIEAGDGGIGVEVTDDGGGFDPEPTLERAARAGRLGLVGMHERVRMLGGSTQIRSRPGGPTVVSASLPAWSAG